MALNTNAVQESISDFSALLPEIGKIIAERGSNLSDDITTVEHLGEAIIHGAARLGVPFGSTAEAVLPLAHQLAGVLATWMQGKAFNAPKV